MIVSFDILREITKFLDYEEYLLLANVNAEFYNHLTSIEVLGRRMIKKDPDALYRGRLMLKHFSVPTVYRLLYWYDFKVDKGGIYCMHNHVRSAEYSEWFEAMFDDRDVEAITYMLIYCVEAEPTTYVTCSVYFGLVNFAYSCDDLNILGLVLSYYSQIEKRQYLVPGVCNHVSYGSVCSAQCYRDEAKCIRHSRYELRRNLSSLFPFVDITPKEQMKEEILDRLWLDLFEYETIPIKMLNVIYEFDKEHLDSYIFSQISGDNKFVVYWYDRRDDAHISISSILEILFTEYLDKSYASEIYQWFKTRFPQECQKKEDNIKRIHEIMTK